MFGRDMCGLEALVGVEGLESNSAAQRGTRLLKQGVHASVRGKLAEPNNILIQAKTCTYVHCNPKMSQ